MDRELPSYYGILGISHDSSEEQIRRAYRKLAMQWHPDKCRRSPSLLSEANRKFQQIQEAYSDSIVGSEKKKMYDLGLYDPEEEEEEGFADFVQEMTSLMADVRTEGKEYSAKELQSMLKEIAQSFQVLETPQQWMYSTPQWFCGQFNSHTLNTNQWGL